MKLQLLFSFFTGFFLISSNISAQFSGGIGDGHHESNASATAPASLPLKFVVFAAKAWGKEVTLDWQTVDEVDTDYFTIERSPQKTDFTPLTTLPAAGNAHGYRLDYRSTDTDPLPGRSYYRIKTTDYDGALTYSPIVSVTFKTATTAAFTLYPNPARIGTDVRLTATSMGDPVQTYSVCDQAGREVLASIKGSTLSTADLSAGTYIVRITGARSTTSNRLLVVTQ